MTTNQILSNDRGNVVHSLYIITVDFNQSGE